ncbi:hypothetical protein ABID82_005174 [Methylobacterium sp. PvP062]|uniref:Uncharacterized protein n=1 Tax=Methylobacterium radiotolerans TaxID=31998 RepID=A0ABV2NTU5_9HYPH|nr:MULTISPECIES: hypothetical protein [unclassified Methylobacterium]MBP2498283.1 hypothetical protein [Methylobacterium sp. PvP105]MBP2505667.1 hypothetical protein [Methylobacterium sp. PvP109]
MTRLIEAVATYTAEIAAAIVSRKSYETDQNSENMNIQKTLDGLAADFAHVDVCKFMHAASVDANFINRQERKNKRFNVYSAQKIANVARAAAAAESLNAYTQTLLRTAIALTKAESSMTHRDAHSALCLDLKVDASKAQHIVRYGKNIASNTADTQSSSSINALQMFNVLKEIRDDRNEVAYVVDLSNATTKRLAKHLDIAL